MRDPHLVFVLAVSGNSVAMAFIYKTQCRGERERDGKSHGMVFLHRRTTPHQARTKMELSGKNFPLDCLEMPLVELWVLVSTMFTNCKTKMDMPVCGWKRTPPPWSNSFMKKHLRTLDSLILIQKINDYANSFGIGNCKETKYTMTKFGLVRAEASADQV